MSAYVISVDRATPGTFAVSLNTGEASWTRSATVVELEAFGDAVAALGFERISLAPLRSARPANSALGALECFLQDVCDRSVRVPGAYALVHRFFVEDADEADAAPALGTALTSLTLGEDEAALAACRREFADYRARTEVELAVLRGERADAEAARARLRAACVSEARDALARKTREILAAVTEREAENQAALERAADARAGEDVEAMYKLALSALRTARAQADEDAARVAKLEDENAALKAALGRARGSDSVNRLTTSSSESSGSHSGSDDGKHGFHDRTSSREDICPGMTSTSPA